MEAWELIEDAVETVGVTLLMLTLQWAAIERGRAHGRRRKQREQIVKDWNVTAPAAARSL